MLYIYYCLQWIRIYLQYRKCDFISIFIPQYNKVDFILCCGEMKKIMELQDIFFSLFTIYHEMCRSMWSHKRKIFKIFHLLTGTKYTVKNRKITNEKSIKK